MHPRHASPKLERQTEGLSTRSGLKYHPESKRYVFCDNSLEDTTCSICLECLGKAINLILTN